VPLSGQASPKRIRLHSEVANTKWWLTLAAAITSLSKFGERPSCPARSSVVRSVCETLVRHGRAGQSCAACTWRPNAYDFFVVFLCISNYVSRAPQAPSWLPIPYGH
jgi:hypothetical protein